MEKIVKKNRNGTKRTCTTINETTIKIEGSFGGSPYRQSDDNDGNIIMIDPDGGPFLSIGDQFGKGIISALRVENEDIIVNLK